MRFGEPVEGSSVVRNAPFCLLWAGERSIMDERVGGLLLRGRIRQAGRRRIWVLRRRPCQGKQAACIPTGGEGARVAGGRARWRG